MKITFEGQYVDILEEMRRYVARNIPQGVSEKPTTTALPTAAKAQGPGPDPFNGAGHVDKPVEKPVEKPVYKQITKSVRTPKQLENDERLRKLAEEKAAAKKAAKAAPAPAPEPKPAEGMDPAEMVKIRQKTIEDLQTAYANGQQKEVFDLLSTHGNGAKSFRELPPEAFIPIRQAIDDGALTS